MFDLVYFLLCYSQNVSYNNYRFNSEVLIASNESSVVMAIGNCNQGTFPKR